MNEVTTIHGEKQGIWVLHCSHWDLISEYIQAKAADMGATLEIIDGRTL